MKNSTEEREDELKISDYLFVILRESNPQKPHFHEEWENNRKILNLSCLKTR